MLSTLRAEQQQIHTEMQRLMYLPDQQQHLQQRLDEIENAISISAVLSSTTAGSSQIRYGGRRVCSDRARIPNRQGYMNGDIDQLASKFKQLRAAETTRNIFAETPEVLARIVRAELQSILMPTIEECLSQYDHRYEGAIRKLQEAITSFSLDLLRRGDPFLAVYSPLAEDIPCLSRNNRVPISGFPPFRNQETNIPGHQTWDDSAFGYTSSSDDPSSSGQDLEFRQQPSQPIRRKTVILQKRNWVFVWTIGIIDICVKTLASFHAKPTNSHHFELSVNFYPSIPMVLRRGFSFMFTTGVDQRGYSQLCPSIAVYRIFDILDVCKAVNYSPEPIRKIRYLLENKLIRLTDRNKFGATYLHVSYEVNLYM